MARAFSVESFVIESPLAKGGELPLKMTCNRYTDSTCSEAGVTLLFAHCVGAHKEQWEPTISHLFKLHTTLDPTQRVREAWAFDWPSHGEAALLNAKVIERRNQYISAFEWFPAIITFLKGPFVQGHRIVGIGHSAGANTIILTLSAFPKERPPYIALVLIEPTSISVERYMQETTTHEPKTKQRTQGTLSRRDQWASRSEAYAWLERRLPWKLWDSQVLQAYVDHGMHTNAHGVSLNLPKKMEANTYPDVEPLWFATELLGQYRSIVPIHMVFGTRNDFVSQFHQEDLCEITAAGLPRKIITVADAGHLIVQEKPRDVARSILDALGGISLAKAHL